ncbi:spore germination protein KA [Paenibacillus endophyticus]|uniref:Spore germination protein KA n=1 Tax=Paenibacillus endophyticus TaxID=1294268 RepID=A0A7W5C5F1_9BACL|nr:spore germination protein [Paenibacillus endophyticus]MBB3151518.1 spore germination protein KA [Paenibacillus endophyticus]
MPTRGNKKKQAMPIKKGPSQTLEKLKDRKITADIDKTIAFIDEILGVNVDLTIRKFHVFGQYDAVIIYFCNMVNPNVINLDILKPLMYMPPHLQGKHIPIDQLKDVLHNDALYHSDCKYESYLSMLIESILRGGTLVAVDGLEEVFLFETRSIDKRSIDQPATEQVIRGPREGFIEPLGTNISLIRYRLQSPDLRIETMELGLRTKSKVAVCYMEGLTNPELVKEVNARLSKIDIDGILDSGYIEQFIEDNHYSPFPQVQYTERPDKVVANLLEGRVSILVDGSPLALLVPTVFSQFYQTIEDYTERFLLMSSIRLARLIALMFSLIFPAIYVSIISFNPELIPTEFAVAVAGGRAGVPFPAVVEVLIIEISMEILREATIRLPQQVGGALSIVGVLVIGQAAVSAGFSSPITIVIIALTTIGSFATPAYNAALALRLLRFPLIIMAGIFGLYGVMIGLILIANHLLSLKSFGVPYLSPLVPAEFQGMKDLLIRGPLWWMNKRPSFLQPVDTDRVNKQSFEELEASTTNALDPKNDKNQQGG